MKYLKTYRLFESDEDDWVYELNSKVAVGFKYSWNHIVDRLIYLTDLGFELIDGSKKQYLRDESDDDIIPYYRNRHYNLLDAKTATFEFALLKKKSDSDVIVKRYVDKGMRNYDEFYHTKWNDNINDINEAIASFCEHFDNCLYNLTLTDKGWLVRFILKEDVDPESIQREHKRNKIEDAKSRIAELIRKFRENLIESTTRGFQPTGFRDKKGNYTNYLGGEFKNGFLIIPVNVEGMRKQIVNQNLPRIERISNNTINYYFSYANVEFRDITKEDLKRVDEPEDEFLGLKGVIIEFDYDKWLKELSE